MLLKCSFTVIPLTLLWQLKLGLCNLQIGKNRNDQKNYESIIWNSDLCCSLRFHTIMKHHCIVNLVQTMARKRQTCFLIQHELATFYSKKMLLLYLSCFLVFFFPISYVVLYKHLHVVYSLLSSVIIFLSLCLCRAAVRGVSFTQWHTEQRECYISL